MTRAQWKARDRYRGWLLSAFEGNAHPRAFRISTRDTPRAWCRAVRIAAAACFREEARAVPK